MTFAADVVGRTFLGAGVVAVENHTFEANTNTNPGAPPNLVFAELPRLVVNPGDLNTLLGSVGLKINPVGNLLITINGLFSLGGDGLQDKFTPLIGLDYSF